MAGFSPFQPQSKTTLVDNATAYQVQTPSAGSGIQYRIRNRSSSQAYLAWAASIAGTTAPTMPSAAPIVGTPQTGVIGMIGSSVENFTLPPNCFFQAITAAMTFEITAGEGV